MTWRRLLVSLRMQQHGDGRKLQEHGHIYSQLDILAQRDSNGPQHSTRHCRITRWQHSTEIKSNGHFMTLGEIIYLHRWSAAMILITMLIYSNFNILADHVISMQKIQHNPTDLQYVLQHYQAICSSTSLSHFHIWGHSLIMSHFFSTFTPFLPSFLLQSVTPSCPPPHNYVTPVQPPPKKPGVLITTIRLFTVIMWLMVNRE